MRSRSAAPFILVSAIFLSLIASALARSKSGAAHTSPNLAARIARVENGIPPIPLSGTEPPLQLNLEKLMQLYKVPGLSVAVIDNFKIAWAKGYGVTEAGGSKPVTGHTLFQAG